MHLTANRIQFSAMGELIPDRFHLIDKLIGNNIEIFVPYTIYIHTYISYIRVKYSVQKCLRNCSVGETTTATRAFHKLYF